jgi:hypothetical protein
MSLPFLTYSCTDCDFKIGSHRLWTLMSYDTAWGYLPIRKQTVWCYECDMIMSAETIANLATIEEKRARVRENMEEAEKLRASFPDKRRFLQKLYKPKPSPPARLASLELNIDWLQKSLDEEIRLAQVMQHRRSPERCLACGGVQWVRIDDVPQEIWSGTHENPRGPYEVGLTHLGCGGTIVATYAGQRVSIADRYHRIYDLEGFLIREEENAEW